MTKRIRISRPLALVSSGMLLLALAVGCGKNEQAAVDLSGSWNVRETITGNCLGEQYPYRVGYIIEARQSGDVLKYELPGTGTSISATVSGSRISWAAAFPEGTGTTTASFTGTVSATRTS